VEEVVRRAQKVDSDGEETAVWDKGSVVSSACRVWMSCTQTSAVKSRISSDPWPAPISLWSNSSRWAASAAATLTALIVRLNPCSSSRLINTPLYLSTSSLAPSSEPSLVPRTNANLADELDDEPMKREENPDLGWTAGGGRSCERLETVKEMIEEGDGSGLKSVELVGRSRERDVDGCEAEGISRFVFPFDRAESGSSHVFCWYVRFLESFRPLENLERFIRYEREDLQELLEAHLWAQQQTERVAGSERRRWKRL
jgi:hypothetical protein